MHDLPPRLAVPKPRAAVDLTMADGAVIGATLRADPAGEGWVLRCPRELEARIFEENVDPTVWPQLKTCPVPLFLIGADPGVEGQQAPAFLTEGLARDHGIPYAMIPETTHFLQIERPREALAAMEIFLAGRGIVAAF